MTNRSSDYTEKFTELFRANRRDILKYFLRRSASPDEAADALAETFLVAWRRIDVVPAGLEGRLWLYGVARNVLLKQFVKGQRATVLYERLVAELKTVAVAAMSHENRSEVSHALSQLSESDREIIELSVWDDFSSDEIASVLGISANAARVRLHRAKHRLAGLMAPPDSGLRHLGRLEVNEN